MPSITDRFCLRGREVDFDLIRKKSVRKNIHVRFGENGRMKVSAPPRASRRTIHLVLAQMQDEIAALRRQVQEEYRRLPALSYRSGSLHYYLGRSYLLDIWRHPSLQPRVVLRTDRIEVHLPEWGEDAVRDRLWAWYRSQAQIYFAQRMELFSCRARWLREYPWDLRLRRMKSSWGTCSSSGVITLNPLLMKAPPPYIDYVIAHEMCHLRELNHGPDFYRLLARLVPNWETLRAALNERTQVYLRW